MKKRSHEVLSQAGLGPHESKVYVSMLNMGALAVSGIVRATGIHRPAVYSALSSLIAKGLVSSVITGRRKQYIAEEPKKLSELFTERERRFREAVDEFEKAFHKKQTKPSIKFMEGKEGLRSVLEDLMQTLPSGATFYRISSRNSETDVERFVPREFRTMRDAKKLEQLVITNSALKGSPHKKRVECFSKMIPGNEDIFVHDIAELIYGDKVAFIDYKEENALIVQNPRFARFQERLFRSLFNRL